MQSNLEVLRGCLKKYPYVREYDPYEEEINKEKYFRDIYGLKRDRVAREIWGNKSRD